MFLWLRNNFLLTLVIFSLSFLRWRRNKPHWNFAWTSCMHRCLGWREEKGCLSCWPAFCTPRQAASGREVFVKFKWEARQCFLKDLRVEGMCHGFVKIQGKDTWESVMGPLLCQVPALEDSRGPQKKVRVKSVCLPPSSCFPRQLHNSLSQPAPFDSVGSRVWSAQLVRGHD